MEFRVVSERENPYLDRVEYVIEISHEGDKTPSRRDIAKYLSETLSLDLSKALIMYIRTFSGMNKSESLVYYYPNGIDWSQIEPPDRDKLAANAVKEEKQGSS